MKSTIEKFIRSDYFFWILFFSLSLFFFFRYWRSQLTLNYIDYGEGSYLYESLLFNQGKILYRDFFLPQPPIIYVIGSLILKFFHSLIFLKYFSFLLFFASNFLLIILLKKYFKNNYLSLIVVFSSFIFTTTIVWWPTFTAEPFLRFFLIFSIFFIFPGKKNNSMEINSFFLSLILVVMFFTKYTSLIYIVFVFVFVFLVNINYFKLVISKFLFFLAFFFIIFYYFFGNEFIFQTTLYRKILPNKDFNIIFLSISQYLLKFLPFYILLLCFFLKFFTKKDYQKAFFFLIPIIWLPNIFAYFFEGTYLYILYPTEILITLGFFYMALSYKIILNEKRALFNFIFSFLFFWSILVLIYYLQIFNNNYLLRSLKNDLSSVNQVSKIIKSYSKKHEEIFAPPFFLVISERKTITNLHDPFFLLYYLIKKENFSSIFNKTIKEIKIRKPKLIIADWRINSILYLIDKHYLKNYKKIKEIQFLNNGSEMIEIYLRQK